MALRPARTIREIKKPAWTRFSRKKPKKSYIKAMPHQDIHQFRMGIKKDDYTLMCDVISEEDLQIRDNALESARQAINKYLEKNLSGNYYFIVRVFPHQVIRENKMIAGAGADRLQKGMRRSFGRPTDKAARVYKNQALFTINTYLGKEEILKEAVKRAVRKLPGKYKIVFTKISDQNGKENSG